MLLLLLVVVVVVVVASASAASAASASAVDLVCYLGQYWMIDCLIGGVRGKREEFCTLVHDLALRIRIRCNFGLQA
jgi:hypothetical protein